jgi:hypothetical protein
VSDDAELALDEPATTWTIANPNSREFEDRKAPVPPEVRSAPPAMALLSPGTMPVPVGGTPVPRRSASLPLAGLSPPLPGAARFGDLLGEACEGANGPSGRLQLPARLSNETLRILGFSSVAMGIMGASLSWITGAGLVLALIGLAVGAAVTVVSSSRRDALWRLALFGALVGLAGAALGVYRTISSPDTGTRAEMARAAPRGPIGGRGAFATRPLHESATETSARGESRQAQAQIVQDPDVRTKRAGSNAARPRLVFGAGDDGSGVIVLPARPKAESTSPLATDRGTDAAAAAPIQWAAAEKNEPQGTGALQVTVSKVVIGKVVSYPIGDLQTLINVSDDPYLIVWFKITNTDAAGSAKYKGWMNSLAEEEKIESKLVDDHGREHKPFRPFNKDEAIQKTTLPGTIFAGQSATDALVFRVLPDDVDSMDLTLSSKAIGRDEDLHFRIPRSMIVHDNSNPLLEGAGK